jgi:TolA-binding protein
MTKLQQKLQTLENEIEELREEVKVNMYEDLEEALRQCFRLEDLEAQAARIRAQV